MSIGERIRFFRRRKGLTQAELGEAMGFAGKSTNVRVAQYEWNRREPKRDVIEQFAEIFDVAPEAIQSPEIDTKIGFMHTLFQMEDLYGLTVTVLDGYICLKQDINHPKYNKEVADDLRAWYVMKNKLTTGSISKSGDINILCSERMREAKKAIITIRIPVFSHQQWKYEITPPFTAKVMS